MTLKIFIIQYKKKIKKNQNAKLTGPWPDQGFLVSPRPHTEALGTRLAIIL